VRNMAPGEMSLTEAIGHHLPDPFYDNYQAEAFACDAMMDKMAELEGEYIPIIIDKAFLRKMIHSHLLYIRRIERE